MTTPPSPDTEPPLPDVRHSWSQSDRFVPRAFVRPLQRFMDTETSGAVFMLVAAIAALLWANSPWWHAQATLWETDLHIDLGHLAHIHLTLVEWINDALMAVFFFLVGLEIKREMVHGELRDPRKAALPTIAAVGGMVVPALVYLAVNAGAPSSDGWGIPMATDIAFAVAIVALVGPRIPNAARVFLLTLAIADDIGAIVVIAVFYTDSLSFGWLGIAAGAIAAIVAAQRLQIRAMPPYVALAILLWFAVHESGVHATLAGVVLGLLTPAWSFLDPRRFTETATELVDATPVSLDDGRLTAEEYELNEARLADLSRLVNETQSPLERLEHQLARWVVFAIVPLFAFANAGVRLTGEALGGITGDRVVLGVVAGLVIGKPVGVFLATWLGDTLGLGSLSPGVTYRHVLGIAMVAGVGFTVALFVAGLAFEPGGPFVDSAKIGILAGSVIAGAAGYAFLRTTPDVPTGAADGGHDSGAPRTVSDSPDLTSMSDPDRLTGLPG